MIYERQRESRVGEERLNNNGELMKIIKYNKAKDITVEFQDEYKETINTSYANFIKGKVENPHERLCRLNEETINKQGYLMKIVQYNKANDIVVEFQDKYKTRIKTTYQQFKNKGLRNPLHAGVYGVGVKGSKHPSRINNKITIEYGIWYSMISRCYNKKFHLRESTYKECQVCNEWLFFDNFYNWLHEQENFETLSKNNNLELDKDILVKGNKIYSPETCCLVPHRVNMLFVKANSLRSNLPIGVRKMGIYDKYTAEYEHDRRHIYVGAYETVEETFLAYKFHKEETIKNVAQEEYAKGNITKQCYDAMMNYEVEITD